MRNICISEYILQPSNKKSQVTQCKNEPRTLLDKDIQIANKCMKKYSTSLIIREMQVKSTMRYHFTLDRMTITKLFLKKERKNKCWWECKEIGTFVPFWEECKVMQLLWKTVQFSQKIENRTTIWFSNPFYFCKRIEMRILKRYLHFHAHSSNIYNSQEVETSKYPSIDEWIKKYNIYIYNEILLSLKKEGNTLICCNMNEP